VEAARGLNNDVLYYIKIDRNQEPPQAARARAFKVANEVLRQEGVAYANAIGTAASTWGMGHDVETKADQVNAERGRRGAAGSEAPGGRGCARWRRGVARYGPRRLPRLIPGAHHGRPTWQPKWCDSAKTRWPGAGQPPRPTCSLTTSPK